MLQTLIIIIDYFKFHICYKNLKLGKYQQIIVEIKWDQKKRKGNVEWKKRDNNKNENQSYNRMAMFLAKNFSHCILHLLNKY